MAALPLSNRYPLCTPRPPPPPPPRLLRRSLLKSPPKILSFQSHHAYKPSSSGRIWRSLSTPKGTTVETSEDETQLEDLEESGSDIKQESLLTIKSLLQLYKEAILNQDYATTSEIEVTLLHIEDEKNKLLGQVTALSEEANSGKERYIRLQADFENFRKRSEKEKLSVRSNAQGEVIESLLPMVDNFERAKQQLKLETEQEKKIDASYQGIYKQFVEIMRSLHVAVVPTVGKPFDPSVHEAIAREESKEFNEGIVIEEFRRGFLLGERLLRPAMVKVSAGPGRPKSNDSATQPSTQESTDSE